jgi:Raf kinase inhibitor-like YbhB/YbcL family protein
MFESRIACTIVVIAMLSACDSGNTPVDDTPTSDEAANSETNDPNDPDDPNDGEEEMSFRVESSAFAHEESIPKKYTCEGADVSPALSWSDAPENTKSFALIVDDPDAPDPKNPKTTWVHWVLYDIPASATSLPENVSQLPSGTQQGVNDWKKTGYGGPCPPVGRHRYFFKLYALDKTFAGELGKPTKQQLVDAIEGHVLKQATLIGTYQKGQ